jgi:polysaccharide biosynthesis transport protein
LIDDSSESMQFDWQVYWDVAVRRRWWALIPFFTVGIAAFGVALLWPAVYRSEALILVEQQKVPAKYVTPNVMSDLSSRLQSMTQQILSRTRLESLIKQFNLYSGQRAHSTMDTVVDRMRADIAIELAQTASGKEDQPTAFRIYYSAENPRIAQQVNSELTSLFIEKSLESRAQQSVSTTNFLQSQLEDARKDLAQQEEQLRQYKMRYLGELPQQEQSNLQILNSLQIQSQASTDALGRAEQQKIYLQSLRSEYQVVAQSPAGGIANPTITSSTIADATLRDLQKQLAELEAKYTPKHPDILRVKGQIAQWEALKKRTEGSSTDTQDRHVDSQAVPVDQPGFVEVDSRLKAVEAEIANDKQQGEKTRKQIEEVRARLGITPVREQQLAEVTRNYENSREHYQSLLQKELESELATNLEKRQEGEQFRILDPPSLPDKPYKPNRPMIILGGWLVGICVGVGAVGLREFTDVTLRSEEELRKQVRVPILARIPVLYSKREKHVQRLRSIAEVASLAVLTLICVALAIYTYRMI